MGRSSKELRLRRLRHASRLGTRAAHRHVQQFNAVLDRLSLGSSRQLCSERKCLAAVTFLRGLKLNH
jgi:hypothetical protein